MSLDDIKAQFTVKMVNAIKAHAIENYEKDGWDFIVECWSDDEIAEEIAGCKNIKQAINRVKRTAKLLNERRAEVQRA